MLYTEINGRICFSLPPGTQSARVTTPGGHTEELMTFTRQPVTFTYDEHGYETVTPDGAPVLEARYTAAEAGAYELCALCGDEVLSRVPFEAKDAGLPGYVRLSTKDLRYFALSTGECYIPVGLNTVGCGYDRLPVGNEHFVSSQRTATTGLKQWRNWFGQMAEAGVNYTRIWLAGQYLEARTELMGVHDLVALERFDAVMSLARQYGIRVKVCMESWRTFNDPSSFAYKRYVDPLTGRQLTDEETWFNCEEWNARWLEDIRPYIARWQNDPTVFAWELWNEIDCGKARFEPVRAFTERMLPRVKALSPRNLAVNSLGSFDEEWKQERQDAFRDMEAMEFQQVHRYLDQGAPMEICRADPVAFSIEAVKRSSRPDKPCILTETGAVNDRHVGPFRFYRNDHLGRIFYDVTYPALFTGAAGSGHIWHWDEYVEAQNLFRHYAPLTEALKGVAADEEGFVPSVIEHGDAWILLLTGKTVVLAYVRNKADRWDYVLRDGVRPAPVSPITLNIPCKSAAAYWIMDEAPGEPVLGGGVTLPAFTHGCVLKMTL